MKYEEYDRNILTEKFKRNTLYDVFRNYAWYA